jgi:hypothetical protein
MIYKAREGQASYGEAIGILLLDTFTPYIPGDVANASTYSFPVRFKKVENYTSERALRKDPTVFQSLLEAARELVEQGVRAITGDCGYMAIHQEELANQLEVPVFLTSLLQIPFISRIIGRSGKIGIICADSRQLDDAVLKKVSVESAIAIKIKGFENMENCRKTFAEQTGWLDSQKIQEEIISLAKEMTEQDPRVRAILLECSCLPPYGAAVQEAVGLPVFDYITMINYVFSAVVKKRFEGFM